MAERTLKGEENYREWGPDIPYSKGERVRFQGQLYEISNHHVSSQFNVPGYCEKYKPVKDESEQFHSDEYGTNTEG